MQKNAFELLLKSFKMKVEFLGENSWLQMSVAQICILLFHDYEVAGQILRSVQENV